MPRSGVLVRALRLILMMRGKHVRPTGLEIAKAFGVTERTARRYLAACVEAGVPMPPPIWGHHRQKERYP